jgi:threonyl-tRNA synthetase
MNCPFHLQVYNSKIRSYNDLPIKYAELGTVYRYERSGTLHGLTRVRGFTQDDAHLICHPEQMPEELSKLVKHGLKMLGDFGFKDINIYLSTKPEKFVGSEEDWETATKELENVLKENNINYKIDEGGGVFYGPKIDIKIKDAIGREWQCTTIQFDFNLPERFDLNFVNKNGEKQRPFMIHRALLGSMERFFGILIEHYAGDFPTWLAPIQVVILPISENHKEYAESILEKLKEENINAEIKTPDESLGKRIRNSEKQKIPYILIVGDKEKEGELVNVRKRHIEETEDLKLNEFINKIKEEIKNKS